MIRAKVSVLGGAVVLLASLGYLGVASTQEKADEHAAYRPAQQNDASADKKGMMDCPSR